MNETTLSRRGFLGGIAAVVSAAFVPVWVGKASHRLPAGWEHVGSDTYRFTAAEKSVDVVWNIIEPA